MRETEVLVTMPVKNPATNRATPKFVFAGKVDGIEGDVIDDWKSTDDPHKFISRRAIAFQAELYALALKYVKRTITGIRYRLITKPGIRFCNKDADLQAYEDRCVEWIEAEPDRLFDHSLPLNAGRLVQARHYLWECCQRILDCRRNARWLPNSGACDAWGRQCPYLPLCECMAANADPTWIIEDQFEVAENTHSELGGYTNKRCVVTQSSLGCLCLCELRYYWRYERGLRKPRTSIDAAWLGSAMHVGLEHFVAGRLEGAYAAIDEWREHNPVLGEDVRKQDQEIAKARAMTRAAAGRWIGG